MKLHYSNPLLAVLCKVPGVRYRNADHKGMVPITFYPFATDFLLRGRPHYVTRREHFANWVRTTF